MKKLALSLLTILLSIQAMSAWSGGFGVIAGYTSSNSNLDLHANQSFHAGFTVKCPFLLGFALQPSLLYNEKGIGVNSDNTVRMGSIELPLSVQWGPDLILVRPYFETVPFVGYNVWNKISNVDGSYVRNSWQDISRVECGVGLGGGLEIWKLQVSARYLWNFNSAYTNGRVEKPRAVMVSVAVIF